MEVSRFTLESVTRQVVSDLVAAAPLEIQAAPSEHLSQECRASLSGRTANENVYVAEGFSSSREKLLIGESLTSPGSDRRCCCSEPLTLTNLLLGPTRSARLPMVTLQLQSLHPLLLVGQQCGSPGSLFPITLPTRRCYSPPDAHPPVRRWHTCRHVALLTFLKSGLDWCRFERAQK